MTRRKSRFGSQTRASDGLIATFELADGTIRVEHFAQVVHTRGGTARIVTKDGAPSIEQVAARADELGAHVLSLSSPETVLTDLQGSRTARDFRGRELFVRTGIDYPEMNMLGQIGRAELFHPPTSGRRLAEPLQRPSRRRLGR